MTKGELLEYLEDYNTDDEIEIIMACDGEGNNFSALANVEMGLVDADGEVIHPDDVDEDSDDFVQDVLILWPM